MHTVHVHAHVKPSYIDAFIKATVENAQYSIKESGIAQFNILQQNDSPNHFLLIEVYYQPEDQVKHKETAHYKKWREMVEPMMIEPRTRLNYVTIFP